MKLIEVSQAKATAQTLLADPVLQWAVNAVLNSTPGVELVICKDCKHYHPYKQSAHYNNVKNQCCRSATVSTKPDDFCSYGERRNNEH